MTVSVALSPSDGGGSGTPPVEAETVPEHAELPVAESPDQATPASVEAVPAAEDDPAATDQVPAPEAPADGPQPGLEDTAPVGRTDDP